MSESVTLPALGESVTEGTVTRWLKQVGERVEVDEPLLEVSTDKVDTEIPSPVAGVLEEILVAEDETVEVGAVLARIGDGSGGGAPEAAPEAAAPVEAQQAPAPEPAAQEFAPQAEAPVAPAPSFAPQPEPVVAQAQPEPAPQPEQVFAPQAPVAESAPSFVPQPESTPVFAPQPEQSVAPQAPATESAPSFPPVDVAPVAPAAEPTAPVGEAPAGPQAPAADPIADLASASPEAQPVSAPPVAESAPAVPEPAETQPSRTAEQQAAAPADPSHAAYVTPIVRKLANEKGIDLGGLSGTGVGGRIRKQDVLDAAAAATSAPQPVVEPEQPAAAPAAPVSELRGTTVPMSRLRKVVAERAVVSLQTSAQLTTVVEVDVTALARLRDRVKGAFQETTGAKLSFLPFFTLAAAEALRSYPIINATIDGDSIVYPDHEHISIAVDTERGLLTPVVRDAAELSIAELATQIADLAERTRENKLKPDELAGGTFTVTNTGSRGALFDTPLVFLPQVAILGTGIVTKRPLVISQDGSDAIAVRSTVYLALSYDHRIVDGADAARFLAQVKSRLEAADFESSLGI